jgi:hypothetical protein
MNNHSKSTKKTSTLEDDLHQGSTRTRVNTRLEIYAKKFYESKLRALIDAKVQEETPPVGQGGVAETAKELRARRLKARHTIFKECWDAESDDVKEEVELAYQDAKVERENELAREKERKAISGEREVQDEGGEGGEGGRDDYTPEEYQQYVSWSNWTGHGLN